MQVPCDAVALEPCGRCAQSTSLETPSSGSRWILQSRGRSCKPHGPLRGPRSPVCHPIGPRQARIQACLHQDQGQQREVLERGQRGSGVVWRRRQKAGGHPAIATANSLTCLLSLGHKPPSEASKPKGCGHGHAVPFPLTSANLKIW